MRLGAELAREADIWHHSLRGYWFWFENGSTIVQL